MRGRCVRPLIVSISLLLTAWLTFSQGWAADPKPGPSAGPFSPREELATFHIPKGFRIELVACEPDVVDPVAIAFDEDGRLFVAEMRGYPNAGVATGQDRKSTRLNSSHVAISYAVFCLKKKIVGEILRVRPVHSRAFEGALLRVDEREVKPQRLSREVVTRAELAGALAPFREGRALVDDGHQIFSMFTRNALNSGVRAPTSPTMGVSALASQYFARSPASSAETPMNPQWMGMPIW